MNKNLKKITGIIMALTMAASLAACGNSSTGSTSSGKGKTVTLKLWHIWTSDSDSNKKNIEDTVKEWNAANPDIQIQAEGTENEAYKTKIKTAISANEAPDIFTSWGAGFSQPFVDSAKVLQLDQYLNDGTKDKLINGTLSNLTYNGKVYALPYTLAVGTFYINKELFDQNNIKIPDNFDELLTAVKAFRAKGITPMAVGEKDRWPGMFYYDALALHEGGTQLSNDALAKKASFQDPAFSSAASKLKQLVDAKAFDNGALGITRDESEVPFVQGKIPMYYNGSWVIGSVEKDGSPVKGKIIVKNFPIIDGAKGNSDEWLGGAIDCLMANANTQYKEETVKALKFIAQSMAEKVYLTGSGLSTWKSNVDESKISPLNLQLSNQVKNAKGFVPWWDIALSGADAETHKDLVANIFAGQVSPEDFAKKMQQINQK
jgi:raffinose/stachyose/melibiose transport system substrate-binding protein